MLRPPSNPFSADGGMRLVQGNLGRATFKTSAVDPARWTIEAPVRVFHDQNDALAAFKAGELERDVIIVVRFQGPAANGMPELHKLTPPMGVLQDKGFKVALDHRWPHVGRVGQGACGDPPQPRRLRKGGPIAKLQDGDVVRLVPTLGSSTCWSTRPNGRHACPCRCHHRMSARGPRIVCDDARYADEAEKGGSAMLAAAGALTQIVTWSTIGGTHRWRPLCLGRGRGRACGRSW